MAEKFKYLESGNWTASQTGTRPVLGAREDRGIGCTFILFVLGILVGTALYLALF